MNNKVSHRALRPENDSYFVKITIQVLHECPLCEGYWGHPIEALDMDFPSDLMPMADGAWHGLRMHVPKRTAKPKPRMYQETALSCSWAELTTFKLLQIRNMLIVWVDTWEGGDVDAVWPFNRNSDHSLKDKMKEVGRWEGTSIIYHPTSCWLFLAVSTVNCSPHHLYLGALNLTKSPLEKRSAGKVLPKWWIPGNTFTTYKWFNFEGGTKITSATLKCSSELTVWASNTWACCKSDNYWKKQSKKSQQQQRRWRRDKISEW